MEGRLCDSGGGGGSGAFRGIGHHDDGECSASSRLVTKGRKTNPTAMLPLKNGLRSLSRLCWGAWGGFRCAVVGVNVGVVEL